MLFPELKQRRDKIRILMAQQGIDAALIACNVNLIYTYGRVVSGYLYLPLNDFARLFVKRPNTIEGERVMSIRKPEQLPDLIKECGLPLPQKLMLEGDELSFREYNRLAACFPETEVVSCGSSLIRQARATKTEMEIEFFRRSGVAHADRPSAFHRDRTADASGRLSRYLPCVRSEYGDIHGQPAGGRQCRYSFSL